MPDTIMHGRFALDVLREVDDQAREKIRREIFLHASTGPDVWMYYRFWMPVLRGGVNRRGAVMHEEKTGTFLMALAHQAAQAQSMELFSLLAGWLCHYCLDGQLHPYINWKAAEMAREQNRSVGSMHGLLELALDRHELAAWGKPLRNHPITREVLMLCQLPDTMREGVERVYQQVYGWIDVWPQLQASVRDQRRYARIVQDSTGVVHGLLRMIPKAAPHEKTYVQRGMQTVDVMNEQHAIWHHPDVENQQSSASVADMRAYAREKAVRLVNGAWAYLKGQITETELEGMIGHDSYLTGMIANK